MTLEAPRLSKVAILADSLALPRGKDWGDVPFEATYPFLLDSFLRTRDLALVIERGMRFRTIDKVLDDWNEIVDLRQADVVVVHVGIVDCAPRVFTPTERAFVEKVLPGVVRGALLDFVHRHRRTLISLRPGNVYMPRDRFEQGVREVVSKARASRLRALFFVNIVTPSDELEARSPGYRQKVREYNELLAKYADGREVHLIDVNQILSEGGGPERLTCDGMHINADGHRALAATLFEAIAELRSVARC
jgi:lysophospholipase L1-like esterase